MQFFHESSPVWWVDEGLGRAPYIRVLVTRRKRRERHPVTEQPTAPPQMIANWKIPQAEASNSSNFFIQNLHSLSWLTEGSMRMM